MLELTAGQARELAAERPARRSSIPDREAEPAPARRRAHGPCAPVLGRRNADLRPVRAREVPPAQGPRRLGAARPGGSTICCARACSTAAGGSGSRPAPRPAWRSPTCTRRTTRRASPGEPPTSRKDLSLGRGADVPGRLRRLLPGELHLQPSRSTTAAPSGTCSSTSARRTAPRARARTDRSIVEQAADLIAEHTGGTLDVVVLTHRHRDHLSGFGDDEAAAGHPGLNPKLVVRPWTEHPDLPRDATAPLAERRRATLGWRSRGTSPPVTGSPSASKSSPTTPTRTASGAIWLISRSTRCRIRRRSPSSTSWPSETGGGEYLSAGHGVRVSPSTSPGSACACSGPPTIEEHAAITKARANDPDEFWLSQLGEIEQHRAGLPRHEHAPLRRPVESRRPVAWIVERLAHQQLGVLNRIVRTVDDALNNTSLILLIDAGDKRLLLPGDAQIENWSWALEHAPEARAATAAARRRGPLQGRPPRLAQRHAEVAVPALGGASRERAPDGRADVDHARTCTGRPTATAVPRGALVTALGQRMDLVRTDELDKARGSVASPPRVAGMSRSRCSQTTTDNDGPHARETSGIRSHRGPAGKATQALTDHPPCALGSMRRKRAANSDRGSLSGLSGIEHSTPPTQPALPLSRESESFTRQVSR